ncbi:enoyl-CoA hydratase/isomerase family protein [Campylobacter canadensis]|uniref:Enoyl-CoA hydratase/isomerase family protein n=1 Tax=Campylobacter canadensis TaxID=449520 RepID=A0ABS7WS59_9BACT|nr:enoyl-CoA hydratase-related protein [Campylobacter canadensis]MBZ7987216.1 enoyl-CoA hydratase/isomerase family protein [Campylobacter canadensis]
MIYFENEGLICELNDGILLLKINRESKANALNGVTSYAMEEVLNKAENDKDVRVIIITGAGFKAFCAGEDLSELSSSGECATVTPHGFGGITNRLSKKPIIAAVNGFAVGGGMEIAMSCDLIVAAEHAKFGLTEVKIGLIASTGGLVRLARDIPTKLAMDMMLTGRVIKADEALKHNLINKVVSSENLLDEAYELARTICKNAPLSLEFSKMIFHRAKQMSLEDATAYCDIAYRFIEKTADGIEGPKAFMEKREAKWQGK